jgi:hypothetical protein
MDEVEKNLYNTKSVNGLFVAEFIRIDNWLREAIGYELKTHTTEEFVFSLKGSPKLATFIRLRQWADRKGFRYEDFWNVTYNLLMGGNPLEGGIDGFLREGVVVFNNLLFQGVIADEIHDMPMRFSDSVYLSGQLWMDQPLQNQYFEYVAARILKYNNYPELYGPAFKRLIASNKISEGFLKKYIYPALLATDGEGALRYAA